MQDLIARFVQLPLQVRSSVSSPSAIAKLEQIEQRFNVSLADLVIRVMIKDVQMSNLATICQNTFHLTPEKSQELSNDLMVQIFSNAASYLGFNPAALAGGVAQESAVHEGSLGIEHHDPEIVKHTGALKYEPADEWYNAETLVRMIVSKLGRPMDDRVQKRLLKIVESRLVDARSVQETQEVLSRPMKIGGMEMDPVTVQQCVALIEQEYQNIHLKHLKVRRHDEVPASTMPKAAMPMNQGMSHPVQPKQPMPIQQMPRPIVPPIKPLPKPLPPVTPPQNVSGIPPLSIPKVGIPAPKVPVAAPIPVPQPIPVIPKPEPISAPRPVTEVPHFRPKVYRDASVQRSVVNDIKIPSKLVGPIEELQQMTLDDFRKLGDSVSACSNRIKEKITMLEHESFEKRSMGLKGWRTCPLMKEYLRIGQESMETNMDISQLLTQPGKASMTPEEFDALAKLNASLRY